MKYEFAEDEMTFKEAVLVATITEVPRIDVLAYSDDGGDDCISLDVEFEDQRGNTFITGLGWIEFSYAARWYCYNDLVAGTYKEEAKKDFLEHMNYYAMEKLSRHNINFIGKENRLTLLVRTGLSSDELGME